MHSQTYFMHVFRRHEQIRRKNQLYITDNYDLAQLY